jgi:hypothetical protein
LANDFLPALATLCLVASPPSDLTPHHHLILDFFFPL